MIVLSISLYVFKIAIFNQHSREVDLPSGDSRPQSPESAAPDAEEPRAATSSPPPDAAEESEESVTESARACSYYS